MKTALMTHEDIAAARLLLVRGMKKTVDANEFVRTIGATRWTENLTARMAEAALTVLLAANEVTEEMEEE